LNELRLCLKITKKVACTVRPAQCPLQWAKYISKLGPLPTNFLVFVGKWISCHNPFWHLVKICLIPGSF
jgi:hypothetical protein